MKMDVANIAKLANLPITDAEKEKFEKQLTETLTYIDELQEVPTKNVKPTAQVTELENVMREDNVTPSLSQGRALQNATVQHNGFFIVPAILDTE